MPTVSIVVDVQGALAQLGNVRRDQIPFATALALTRTAMQGRDAVRAKLPGQFTLRNTWTMTGVQFQKATKYDLTSWVYFAKGRDYMLLQETGGIKLPHRGAHLAVPMAPELKRMIIPKNLRPRFLLGNDLQAALRSAAYKSKGSRRRAFVEFGKGFLLTLRGTTYIVVSTGKGRNSLKFMYVLVPQAKINQRLRMAETVTQVVRQNFGRNFGEAMAQATATAR